MTYTEHDKAVAIISVCAVIAAIVLILTGLTLYVCFMSGTIPGIILGIILSVIFGIIIVGEVKEFLP